MRIFVKKPHIVRPTDHVLRVDALASETGVLSDVREGSGDPSVIRMLDQM